MPSPTDSDRRKTRDKMLRTQDEAIAENLAEAQRSGELQSAPSYGKPMQEADGWHETPAEFRLPFKILKNAGVAPPEIELFHRRAALRLALAECSSENERKTLQQHLSELEQLIAFRLERLRVTGRISGHNTRGHRGGLLCRAILMSQNRAGAFCKVSARRFRLPARWQCRSTRRGPPMQNRWSS
jgi:hypothetical protein